MLDKLIRKIILMATRPDSSGVLEQIVPLGRQAYNYRVKTFSNNYIRNVFLGDSNAEIHRPIFIVGAPRSGTTFLGDCMAQIESVAYFFEPVYTKAVGYLLAGGELLPACGEREFRKTYGNLMRGLDDKRFCEKTPTNVFLMEELRAWFPDAKFIHIIRDGIDMAASHVQKGWLTADRYEPVSYEIGGYRNGPVPQFWVNPSRHDEFRQTSDFNRSIWAWWTHVQAGLTSAEKLGADACLEVRYEEILNEPSQQGKRIVDFLGDIDEGNAARFIRSLESGSLASIGKGRRTVSEADIEHMMPEAHSLLAELGY